MKDDKLVKDNVIGTSKKLDIEKSVLQIRFELQVKDFMDNGFTEQQSLYLTRLLNEYLPLI